MSERRRSLGLRRRPRVGTLLSLVLLVPILVVAVQAASDATERWHERGASSDVRRDADELGYLMTVRSTVAEELIQSSALAFSAEFGVGADELHRLLGVDLRAELERTRSRFDTAEIARRYPELARGLSSLAAERLVVDTDASGFEPHGSVLDTLTGDIDRIWNTRLLSMRKTVEVSTSLRRSAAVHAQIDTVALTFEAYTADIERAYFGSLILTGDTGVATRDGLIAAGVRYSLATRALSDELGPHGLASWRSWRAAPSTERIETLLDQLQAESSAGSVLTPEAATYGVLMVDGLQWLDGLTTTVTASADDLADLALRQEHDAARALITETVLATVFVLGAVVAGFALTRAIDRPLRRLESFARGVSKGDFDLPAPEVTGPREIAQTSETIADMTATFAAVAAYATQLASDPGSPTLDVPLPGQTGLALQATVNRLRHSMQTAERQRVELEELATHDGLTGLLNRATALEAIERGMALAHRLGRTFGVIFLDLDGLKAINDVHGHQAGDEAIRLAATALRSATRAADVVARIGGDEFLVGATCQNEREVIELANRIREAVAEQVLTTSRGERIAIRCSIGVATAHADELVKEVVGHADSALYQAKHQGRDSVCVFPVA